jgi:diguanylate cyclase (GGDEF)-like protein/PAS domain S-box-containing protein
MALRRDNGAGMGFLRPDHVGPPASAPAQGIPLEQYRVAFERNPQPMWVCDLDTRRFIAVNDAAIEHYGYSRSEFLAMTIEEIHPLEDIPALHETLGHDANGLERPNLWRHRLRDGSLIDAEVVTHGLSFGGVRARVTLATDVTARRSAETAQSAQLVVALRLAESATIEEAGPKLLDVLGSTMGWGAAAIWRLDESATVLRCSAFWCAPSASSSARLELESALRGAALASGEGWAGRVWESAAPVCENDGSELEGFDGAEALERASLHRAVAVPIHGGESVLGVLEFFSGPHRQIGNEVLRTLTIASAQLGQFLERKRAERDLAYEAIHDPLTRLPNRVLFLDRLKVALARSRRRPPSVAVLSVDIDNFKAVNDSLGPPAGDELLCAVATRISLAVRPGDTVARFGADEFVVIADQIGGIDDAAAIAERISTVLGDPFALVPGEHLVTASIGIAISKGSAQEAEDLIRDSNTAMCRAKQRGRGPYEVFDKGMHARLLGRLRTERDLRDALYGDQLRLHYQPVVELATGTIVGVEALVRWEHPERGFLAPSEFIPLAEASGLILPIGRWVLTEACRQAAAWQRSRADRPPLPMSVNVSAMQARHGSLARVVEEATSAAGLDLTLLRLELTESVLLEVTDSLVPTLRNLKDQGVQLVLDDFGTGYSALGYLDRFPIDALKLDRSFFAGIGTDSRRTGIVRAVIDMARALEIEVVAEGVENASEAGLVLGLGCGYAQGFYFAAPGPAEDIAGLIVLGEQPSGRAAE